MKTHHRLIVGDARALEFTEPGMVQLLVTSPPYPMIEMWDGIFSALDPRVAQALDAGDGGAAFERMHVILDDVWRAAFRAVADGGFVCINVGDATRTIEGEFRLYTNHARISQAMQAAGFIALPDILWRKPTNAPNKFMGSGMLPAGAYVTYEHEYILIFRKGPKRVFASPAEKLARRRSAFFWEERNAWFSDVWTSLTGTRQTLGDPEMRERSAAFPFEVPYRLIQMLSMAGDTVLDPFAGVGTTLAAAVASGRSSIGIERDVALAPSIARSLRAAADVGRDRTQRRFADHAAFVAERLAAGKEIGYTNATYGFPVITEQEVDLEFLRVDGVEPAGDDRWIASHSRAPLREAEPAPAGELPFAAG